jgi:hypothetical protein
MRDSRTRTIGALTVAAIVLCAVLVFVEPPENTLFWGAVFDAGHPPLFGAFALLVLILVSRRRGKERGAYFLAFAVSLGLGIASELLQAGWSTDANPWDVVRDATGITAFLLGYAAFDRERKRAGLLLLAGAIFCSAYVPIIATLRAYALRDAAFPVVFNFDAPWQQRFLEKNLCDVLPHGRLVLQPGEFPGIVIEEPYPDWTGWEQLTFRVSSSLPRPVSLVVRIDDIEHNNEHSDRFNRAFTIGPGDNAISIPVADIGAAPKTRKLDLAHVRRVFLFVPALNESVTLDVSELRLER